MQKVKGENKGVQIEREVYIAFRLFFLIVVTLTSNAEANA